MGTPEFAVPSLAELDKTFDIPLVITQPDKPAGRKQRVAPSAIKVMAELLGIPVFQPESAKNGLLLKSLKQINPDLVVVVAYGKLIPHDVLALPKYGVLNLHPSLLPKYRGPSPIQSAILNNEKKTGISIMLLDNEMDHGPILYQKDVIIETTDNAGTLHDKLSNLGASVFPTVINDFISDELRPYEQNHSEATFCKLLTKDDGKIDPASPVEQIHNQIRALTPWPGSFFLWRKKRMIIHQSAIGKNTVTEDVGELFLKDQKLFLQCSNGTLEIIQLQVEGKKTMGVREFIRGNHKMFSSE